MSQKEQSVPQTADGSASPQLHWIRGALRATESQVRRLRKADTWAIILGTVGSSLAAFLAGVTALKGQPVVSDSWVTTCGMAAGFSLIAGMSTGLHKGLGISTRLSRASTCTGKLRALDLAASMGRRDPAELAGECEQVAAEYADLLIAE
jgi:hypothetical protein